VLARVWSPNLLAIIDILSICLKACRYIVDPNKAKKQEFRNREGARKGGSEVTMSVHARDGERRQKKMLPVKHCRSSEGRCGAGEFESSGFIKPRVTVFGSAITETLQAPALVDDCCIAAVRQRNVGYAVVSELPKQSSFFARLVAGW